MSRDFRHELAALPYEPRQDHRPRALEEHPCSRVDVAEVREGEREHHFLVSAYGEAATRASTCLLTRAHALALPRRAMHEGAPSIRLLAASSFGGPLRTTRLRSLYV